MHVENVYVQKEGVSVMGVMRGWCVIGVMREGRGGENLPVSSCET